MVWEISIVLEDLNLFTNALANPHLSFIIDWDGMSENGKNEMLDFWSAIQREKRLSDHAYWNKIGYFHPQCPHLQILWIQKGGKPCYKLGKGILNMDHPVLKDAGITNWGQWCYLEAKVIFETTQEKLVAERC